MAAGYAAVSAAAVLWAIGGALASRLIDRGASLVELTQARAWITALVMLVVLSRRPRAPRRLADDPPAMWVTVLFGLSIAGANVCYYASLARLPVAVAITVQYTAPALVVLWVSLSARARPSNGMIAALVAAMVGVGLLAELPVLLSEEELRLDGLGLLFAGMSAVSFAAYMVSGERVGRSYGAQGAVLRGFVVASGLWIVVQIFRGRPDTLLDPDFIPGVLFLAVFTTIAPFLLFVWGLGRVRVSDAGIVSALEPLTAAVIAWVWLGQSLSGWQLAGGLLVIVGIGLVQAAQPASEEVLAERAARGVRGSPPR